VYNPDLYRPFIFLGKMDYLYDKVAFYDSLKHIVKGYGWTDHIPKVQEEMADIEHQMLHFLENHDEQRLPCDDFAGFAENGKPAMVVSALISTSPTMIYFGQEVGEPALEQAGFGSSGRTSIFDYIGVPHHQRWINHKSYDGGLLYENERILRDFYRRLMKFTISSSALMGAYREIHYYNRDRSDDYNHRVFSFVRWSDEEKLIVVSNFDISNEYKFELKIPENIISEWGLKDGVYTVIDQLYGNMTTDLRVKAGEGNINIIIVPLASFILRLES
jgi:glycosidase